jgi:ribosomal protein S18 acetylase RimI-like enzyme
MSEAVRVRLANPDDAAVLAAMNQEFNEIFMTPEQVESRLRAGLGSETVLVVEVDGQVVGFSCIQVMSSVCYAHPWAELTELYVQPSFRRRGLGRDLVQESERMAKEQGATRIHLLTGVENMAGRALYTTLGYIKESELLFHKCLKEKEG